MTFLYAPINCVTPKDIQVTKQQGFAKFNLTGYYSRTQYSDVSLPIILIWGNQDSVIVRAGVEMTKQYMKGEYFMIELDARYALVPEKFERVN